jgi:hypothetical protein
MDGNSGSDMLRRAKSMKPGMIASFKTFDGHCGLIGTLFHPSILCMDYLCIIVFIFTFIGTIIIVFLLVGVISFFPSFLLLFVILHLLGFWGVQVLRCWDRVISEASHAKSVCFMNALRQNKRA